PAACAAASISAISASTGMTKCGLPTLAAPKRVSRWLVCVVVVAGKFGCVQSWEDNVSWT
ncbi:MAG: hypothetical protein QMB08_09425, partial [Acidimicrobiales bacterium]